MYLLLKEGEIVEDVKRLKEQVPNSIHSPLKGLQKDYQ